MIRDDSCAYLSLQHREPWRFPEALRVFRCLHYVDTSLLIVQSLDTSFQTIVSDSPEETHVGLMSLETLWLVGDS